LSFTIFPVSPDYSDSFLTRELHPVVERFYREESKKRVLSCAVPFRQAVHDNRKAVGVVEAKDETAKRYIMSQK